MGSAVRGRNTTTATSGQNDRYDNNLDQSDGLLGRNGEITDRQCISRSGPVG